MTKKQKEIMLDVLKTEWAEQALWTLDDLQAGTMNKADFRFVYGCTPSEARKALQALIKELEK